MNNSILLLTDLHLRPSILDINKKFLFFALEEIKKRKPKYVGILGDTLHTKNVVHLSCLNLFQQFIEEISRITNVILLIGNHDWGVPYTDHPFKGFKYIQNVTVVEEYYVLNEKNVFISYCREKERFLNFLEEAGTGIERIFAHMDVDGLTPGSGWEEVSPFLNPDQLSNYKQVFSGHLHLAQELKLKSGTEIVMVGTGYTTDFGESDQHKRIIELDLDSGVWESIPTNMTMHKTLKINITDPFPKIPDEDISNGVEYRLVIKGSKEQIAALIIPKNYPAKITYDIVSNSLTRIELSSTATQQDIMETYIDSELDRNYKDDKEKFDKSRLILTGKKLLPNG